MQLFRSLRASPVFKQCHRRSICRTFSASSSLTSSALSGVRQHKPNRHALAVAATLSGIVWLSSSSCDTKTFNHCQVPCGIFDDPAIIDEMKQASTTIRKAIVQATALHSKATGLGLGSDPLAMNQMIRWVNTKEEHCNKIIKLTSEYCLCQRVKAASFKSETEYLEALKFHHIVMQAAMKAKQSMDVASVDALDHALADLAQMYTK